MIVEFAISQSRISTKKKRGRPTKVTTAEHSATPVLLMICGNCFARLGKGYTHNCESRRSKVTNIEKLLSSPTTSQRVASRIIDSSATPLLATLGPRPKPIAGSNLGNSKKQLFSSEDMSMVQRDLNLSNYQVVTLAEDLRASSGSRKLIESGMKHKLRTKNCQLSDYFEKKVCNFVEVNKKEKTKNNFTQNVVVCNDLNGLVDK